MTATYPRILGVKDAGLSFKNDGNYSFARKQTAVPIALHEVQRMATVSPLALVKRPESWLLVAGTTFKSGDSMLIGPRGAWLGSHIPERLTTYPLTLVPDPAGDGGPKLAVFADGPRLVAGGDDPLLDKQGQPTEVYDAYVQALSRHFQSDQRVAMMAAALEASGCLKEMPSQGTGKNAPVSYGVDIKLLQALNADQAAEMLANGCLALAFALHFSATNIRKFVQMAQRRSAQQGANEAPAGFLAEEQVTGFNFDI